jgi:hypothetical protein
LCLNNSKEKSKENEDKRKKKKKKKKQQQEQQQQQYKTINIILKHDYLQHMLPVIITTLPLVCSELRFMFTKIFHRLEINLSCENSKNIETF